MPVSILEMAAMGLPIVDTAVGVIADLLSNKETGLLVPDDDEIAMTQAVESFCLMQLLTFIEQWKAAC